MVAQLVKRPILRSLKEVQLSQYKFDSWFRHAVVVGGEILPVTSVGARGEAHECRNKHPDWDSSKTKLISSHFGTFIPDEQ